MKFAGESILRIKEELETSLGNIANNIKKSLHYCKPNFKLPYTFLNKITFLN